jgi:hypothetical protein
LLEVHAATAVILISGVVVWRCERQLPGRIKSWHIERNRTEKETAGCPENIISNLSGRWSETSYTVSFTPGLSAEQEAL